MARQWHLAPALVTLLDQCNRAYPGRDKRSDGTLGDRSHASRASDHNPDGTGTVKALDLTHAPYWLGRWLPWRKPSMDCQPIVDALVNSRDPRIAYIIFQRRIWQPGSGWSVYGGPSPHLEHLHISVTSQGANNASAWNIGGGNYTPSPSQPATVPTAQHPTSNPSASREKPVFCFIKNPHNPAELWATDFMEKYHVGHPDLVQAGQLVALFRGMNVGPIDMSAAAFDSIPDKK